MIVSNFRKTDLERKMAELKDAVEKIERAKMRKQAPPPPPKMRILPDWF